MYWQLKNQIINVHYGYLDYCPEPKIRQMLCKSSMTPSFFLVCYGKFILKTGHVILISIQTMVSEFSVTFGTLLNLFPVLFTYNNVHTFYLP